MPLVDNTRALNHHYRLFQFCLVYRTFTYRDVDNQSCRSQFQLYDILLDFCISLRNHIICSRNNYLLHSWMDVSRNRADYSIRDSQHYNIKLRTLGRSCALIRFITIRNVKSMSTLDSLTKISYL